MIFNFTAVLLAEIYGAREGLGTGSPPGGKTSKCLSFLRPL